MRARTRTILACALSALTAVSGVTASTGGPGGTGGGRTVRAWDFDERRQGNVEDLPMFWTKLEGPGLPHYVNGRLAYDMGRSSRASFRFDLNGGSLVYRYDPTRMPVQRGARYRVETFARTTALANARARLTAYFVDRDLRPLPESVTHSKLFAGKSPADDWQPLTVDLRCDDPDAAFLVVELGLLQPALHSPASTLGARTLFNQDVTGTAWFTDLSVSQVPELKVTGDVRGNVFPRGTPVRLWMTVTDRVSSDLQQLLEVTSADGRLVHQRSGPLDASTSESGLVHRQLLQVPELPAGWYKAEVSLSAKGREVARSPLSFIVLPDDGEPVPVDGRFGVIASHLAPSQWDLLPRLLPLLGTGRVKVTVWGDDLDIQKKDAQAFESLLERLQVEGIMPTATITGLPPDLAAALGPLPANAAGGSTLARLPRLDESLWKPRLSYLIARHASHLDRWQLGPDGSEEYVHSPDFRKAYALVCSAFEGLVHSPDVAIPWPATIEPPADLPATAAVAVPPSVLPEQIPLYVQDTRDRGTRRLSLTLLPLGTQYGREAHLKDLAQRVTTALSAGAARYDLTLPFSPDGQPDESFLVLRTLQRALTGTTARGQLKLADNVEAHLFDHQGRGVLVLWSKENTAGPGTQTVVPVNLGGRPRLIDLFGNVSPLRPSPAPDPQAPTAPVANSPVAAPFPEPDRILVPLGALPVIVDGIDPAMALFRVSVALDNPLLESQFQPHTRKLTFTNTFPDFISGSVTLKAPQGWTVMPPTFAFNLNPGETFSKEIQLEIPYNTLAGTKPLDVRFELTSNTKPAKFAVPVDIRLGLNDVGLQTIAVREGDDVVVQVLVNNYGTKPINYTAFALFPGQARQERLVTNLGPGRATVKRFRFPAATVPDNSNRKIRVGLREIDGTRILNDEIAIP